VLPTIFSLIRKKRFSLPRKFEMICIPMRDAASVSAESELVLELKKSLEKVQTVKL
jgi:hypothetical protein